MYIYIYVYIDWENVDFVTLHRFFSWSLDDTTNYPNSGDITKQRSERQDKMGLSTPRVAKKTDGLVSSFSDEV